MTTPCCPACKDHPGASCQDQPQRGLVLIQAPPSDTDDLIVWGPMSAEIVSRTKDLVRVKGIEGAMPTLLRRAATLKHRDEVVGPFVPLVEVDESRLPTQEALDKMTGGTVTEAEYRAMVSEVTQEYGGLPSAIITVTPSIVKVFPRLAALEGQLVPFLATRVVRGDEWGQRIGNDVLEGRLDSYSVTSPNLKDASMVPHCDANGCVTVRDIKSLDLASVNFCSSTQERSDPRDVAVAANAAAGFIVVQQATPGEALLQTGEDPAKDYVTIHDLQVAIEHPRGSKRTGTGPDGAWEREMLHHYGRILGTRGPDGDMLDAYVGPTLESPHVFVVDQVNADGAFDEHKVLLGFEDLGTAVAAYKAHYPRDWKCGPVSSMSIDQFHAWLENGVSEPASRFVTTSSAERGSRPVDEGNTQKELENMDQAQVTAMPEMETPTEQPDEAASDDAPVDAVVELSRRVEALEQELASIKDRIGGETPPEEPDAPVAQADDPEEPDDDKDKETSKEALLQAFTKLVDDKLPKLVQTAVAKAIPAPQPAAQPPKAAPAQQVETPSPSDPPAPGADTGKLQQTVDEIDNGDVIAFRKLLNDPIA